MNAQPKPTNVTLHTTKLADTQPQNMDNNTLRPNISDRYVYHMTDRDNLASIVSQGLRSASSQQALGMADKVKHLPTFFDHQPYDNRVVMFDEKRRAYKVDDCVQFVFTAKDPRLFNVINSKNIDQDRIIFLCMKADKVAKLGGCVSDRYAKAPAYELGEEPKFYEDLKKAEEVLDWELIETSDMGTKDSELKITLTNWAKTAQAFVPERFNFDDIEAIVVFNDEIKTLIQEQLKSLGVDLDKVTVLTEAEATAQLPTHPKFYWFKDKIIGHEKESLVTGPKELYHLYKECISAIKENRKQRLNSDSEEATTPYRFENVESLVKAIENDFTVLPELKGIYKLETDTHAHHEDVGAHTLSTVHNLKDSKYYQNADDHLKSVIKLSAYLHDIGKGPREKWPEGIQHRYPDHPRDSISQLKRILTEEIKGLSDKDIHDICLMVIYHDVVGECENKRRNYQEVANIVECDEDLEMLYCISEADIRSIKESWYERFTSMEDEFREDIRRMKNESNEIIFP